MTKFNIEAVPLVSLYLATDRQKRIRLSADTVGYFDLDAGKRIVLGYDRGNKAIALRQAETDVDPTAATVDKRGYISAGRFFSRTQLMPEPRRYEFAAVDDGWYVFTAIEEPKVIPN
jgi:hypothetical protein